ncbi:uncharacterized protein LOC62_01G001065 [Vanrija pseudolonga]|uniref:Uncharacterized protein n=1 Tax=Vanrija pseudolonga TaxID=143232 RepID=A0AAF1BF33_9TREE|nr:hypothetical protein LOC62_01G001065 [Vanrija pseudolonga]
MNRKQVTIMGAVLGSIVGLVIVIGILYQISKCRPGAATRDNEVRSTPFTRGEAPASAWFAGRRHTEAQAQAQAALPPPPYAAAPVGQRLSVPSAPTPAHLPPSPVTSLPPYRPSAK